MGPLRLIAHKMLLTELALLKLVLNRLALLKLASLEDVSYQRQPALAAGPQLVLAASGTSIEEAPPPE